MRVSLCAAVAELRGRFQTEALMIMSARTAKIKHLILESLGPCLNQSGYASLVCICYETAGCLTSFAHGTVANLAQLHGSVMILLCSVARAFKKSALVAIRVAKDVLDVGAHRLQDWRSDADGAT
eukprot:scaffold2056_cov129-Isochrysis_galbana.AAC.8